MNAQGLHISYTTVRIRIAEQEGAVLGMMGALWISLAQADAPWEGQAAVGAEIDPSSHGVVNLGIRRGPWAAELETDTLDLRWSPEGKHGRAWMAARAEGGAAGLLISPWTDGAPDPSRALTGWYAGVEGGAVRYGPAGLYFGAQGFARVLGFGALDSTEIPVPYTRPWLRADALAGWWQKEAHASLVAGAEVDGGLASPHLSAEVVATPSWRVTPVAELRAGWGWNQDFFTRTRLGGLNPYVVPLAGAGWAEWWVQDYASARGGVAVQGAWGHVGAVMDAAWFDGQEAAGFAVIGRAQHKRLFADASVGMAPWIPRAEGVSRVSAWVAMGLDWGPLRVR